MVLEKRGNPRKSRRIRLPSASYTGTTRFTPDAEVWEGIEKPFGLRFSDEDRRELVDIVEAYFQFEPFERAAPFADDAQAWLADVRTKADAFLGSLQPPALQREAAFFVQRLITENLDEGQQSGAHKWNEIIRLMSAFVAALAGATTALSRHVKGGGFVEDTAGANSFVDSPASARSDLCE